MNKKIRISISITCIAFAVIYLLFCYYGKQNKSNNTNSEDYVEFLDVGQGDCTLISSNGKNCLIDTGTSNKSNSIIRELENKNINNIDLISISHFHADHTGSLLNIIKKFSVDNLMFPAPLNSNNIQKSVLAAKNECISKEGNYVVARKGQTVNLGDFKLSVLYQNITSNDENNRSVYIMAKIGDIKFFFTGDGEKQTEDNLLKEGLNIDCDVLKVPHHGGRTSSCDSFLNSCTPEYAVICCGKGNIYAHPHKETIDRLKERNIKTYRTDENGDVLFSVIDDKLVVNTDK